MHRLLAWFALLSCLAGVLLQNPPLFMLGALLSLVALITVLWGRYALAGVTYTRQLGTPRLYVGQETDLVIEIVNAKPLPLAWLKTNDEFPVEMELLKGTLHYTHKETRRMLTNLLSMRFYERVRKRYPLRALRRGALEFGPVELSSGDMFGFMTQHRLLPHLDRVIVYPRVVPVQALGLPAAHPFGDAAAPRRIAEDPLRLRGVRPYAPGDSLRAIHWKATARHGSLQTRVFEPAASRASAIFLDVQTLPSTHQGFVPEYLELAVTAAASVAGFLLDAREAVGLYANASRRTEAGLVRLPPSRRPNRWFEVLDTLAWLNSLDTVPLERYLRGELYALPLGVGVIVISAVLTDDLAAALLDCQSAGHPVTLLAIGETAPENPPEGVRWYWIGGREAYLRLAALDLSPDTHTGSGRN